MRVRNLCLEVTRRCNMRCDHCLRGDAEDVDMTTEIIDKVFDSVEEIGEVTFTGGEPTLNMEIIKYFFREAERNGKMPYCFFIATNGLENQEELAIELLRQWGKMEEKDYCGVALSIDEFHDNQGIKETSILTGLSFYTSLKETNFRKTKLINEGRAKNIGGYEKRELRETEELYLDGGEIEMLYVAANGNVIGCCDMSFNHIDQLAVTNVWELKNYLTKLEEEEE